MNPGYRAGLFVGELQVMCVAAHIDDWIPDSPAICGSKLFQDMRAYVG